MTWTLSAGLLGQVLAGCDGDDPPAPTPDSETDPDTADTTEHDSNTGDTTEHDANTGDTAQEADTTDTADADACASPCLNGGTCVGPDLCTCLPAWGGPTCESPRATDCVTLEVTTAEGDEVEPVTTLNLASDPSGETSEPITRWGWSVEQPQGSVSRLTPSEAGDEATFDALVVGTHRFSVEAWSEEHLLSCEPGVLVVDVIPTAALYVELLWDTPGDPDQSDVGVDIFANSVGSDMDLHLLHANAAGEWFHPDYDCHARNHNPTWDAENPASNPRLLRDDTDGGGPESIRLELPEADLPYTVGAHYWKDWVFGPSWATVNIFVYGQLRFTWERVRQVNHDMWEAATITWPTPTIERISDEDGQPVIIPDLTGDN